ncbi:MAG: multiheme c-type cytochrome [Isosphaeraceae bacterium]|nr:multiheme c-type cytochrome [Isosphaeraceae bacterium]
MRRAAGLILTSIVFAGAIFALMRFSWKSNSDVGATALRAAAEAYRRGDWETARRAATERLVVDRDDLTAIRILARASARLGRVDSARSLYSRLGNRGAEAEDYLVLGLVLRNQGDRSAALLSLRSALTVEPANREAVHLAADLLVDSQSPAEAEAILRASRLEDGASLRRLGLARLARGDAVEAFALFERAVAAGESVEAEPMARAGIAAGRAVDVQRILEPEPPSPSIDRLRWAASLLSGRLGRSEPIENRDAHHETWSGAAAPYVGAAACGECHPGEYRDQQSSRHARTFRRASDLDSRLLPPSSVPDPRDATVIHKWSRRDGRIEVEVAAGERTLRGLIEYALGSGDRGLSFVARDEAGAPRELRLSRYGDGVWDLTVEHPALPESVEGRLGRPVSEDALDRCLGCHATTSRAARTATGPEAADSGIGCESCHGPGGVHVAAARAGLSETGIGHAAEGKQRSDSIMSLCARCHSAKPNAKPTDHDFVRFQSSTLVMSSCYRSASDRLDCTTCHDPHQNASRDRTHYDRVCLECHDAAPAERVCRVATNDCARCHMPTTWGAAPRTPFTEHRIGIHESRDGG